MHYKPQIHCLGKKHVWLLLLRVYKHSTCSVLTCLYILAAQYSWVAHSVFLYLHCWHIIIFPPCWHRLECFDIHRHVSVCVLNYLSYLQHAHYIKHKTYFSGCQGYSVHIWLHVHIFGGVKTLIFLPTYIFIVGFVLSDPFSHLSCNLSVVLIRWEWRQWVCFCEVFPDRYTEIILTNTQFGRKLSGVYITVRRSNWKVDANQSTILKLLQILYIWITEITASHMN